MKPFYNYFFEGLKPEISVEQLMKKHNVSKSDINKALDKGTKVEMEHTTDKATARRIASHHIDEMLDYYDRLAKIEN
jgi:hypothetical protein